MNCAFLNDEVKPCVSYLKGGFCSLPGHFRCLEYIKRKTPDMSYSSMRDYTTCRRKYYLGNIQGVERIKLPVRMAMGSIASGCTDIIHDSVNPGRDFHPAIEAYKKEFTELEYEIPDELIKIEGFMEAYQELAVSKEKGRTQYHWKMSDLDGVSVHGYMDLVIDTDENGGYGYEFKYTGKPASYTKFTVMDQVGLYFLGSTLERIVIRCLQVPQLRSGKKEAPSEFKKRVTNDVLARPKHYVVDTSYWRHEFDLEGIKARVNVIGKEIGELLQHGVDFFYQTGDRGRCFDCWYLDICSTGVISDTLYKKRERRVENEAV